MPQLSTLTLVIGEKLHNRRWVQNREYCPHSVTHLYIDQSCHSIFMPCSKTGTQRFFPGEWKIITECFIVHSSLEENWLYYQWNVEVQVQEGQCQKQWGHWWSAIKKGLSVRDSNKWNHRATRSLMEKTRKRDRKKSLLGLRTASKAGLKVYPLKELKFNLIRLWSILFLRDKLLSKAIEQSASN